ncbi:MAG: hypothetical protein GX079_03640 [Tissierellia bacterium]|nr:hypothetical protein [Tissierellia bacterium]
MIISKNPFNPSDYEHRGLYFISAVFTSSLQSDLSVLTKTFRTGNIEEYEEMVEKQYKKLYERILRDLEEEELDGLFNASFTFEVLYAGTLLLYVSGDKVKKL